MNIVASLAVQRTLENLIMDTSVKVKWPNDILLNSKKVTGILIENTLKRNSIQWSVLGFGINVNQEKTDLPRATSLFNENQSIYDIQLILEEAY